MESRPAATSNGSVVWLTIRGARQNNLKNINVSIPLGRFTCVTGVSGSGKSSLVNDILYAELSRRLNRATAIVPGEHDGIDGAEHLDKIIAIDQTPIGRTPRSNPATYIKLFDEIRDLFTRLPDAKLRGFKPGRFSFNVPAGPRGGGRCEACEGNGANRIEMDFLADVWVRCPVCEGRRFSRETLQIEYKGKSISDVLEMDVQQALAHFENVPRIRAMLQTLHDVGLDYLKLGQSSTTLSGGEAQRIKLARELVRKPTGGTLYVLDEPTTGLHFEDIRRLLNVLHGFVDGGNTVVVIEHNLDVIKTADWIIDLGPEGGAAGGRIVATGTPETVAEVAESHTGAALREVLNIAGRSAMRTENGAAKRGKASVPPGGEDRGHFEEITVRGACEHNLRDLTVSFPRNRMTVCTGVSGSGKTSFAIDTVFAEGYRRYVESLSAYARQFLGQMAKPRVDHVEGLSPAICIEQRAASRSPRSTVGTITEVYDYMRVLWARLATPYCPQCRTPVGAQTIDEIVDRIFSLEPGTPISLLAPIALGSGETYPALFQRLRNSGYARVRIDGTIHQATLAPQLDARRRHRIEVVIDRTIVRPKSRGRISESVEHALALGEGVLVLLVEAVETVPDVPESPQAEPAAVASHHSPAREMRFSQRFSCPTCGEAYDELSPVQFSFNSPLGWCETCEGLGVQRGAPAAMIITRPHLPLLQGAVTWHGRRDGKVEPNSKFGRMMAALAAHIGADIHAPLDDWTATQRQVLLFGSDDWIETGELFVTAPRRSEDGKAASAARFQWRGFFPAIDQATRVNWELRHRLRNVVTDIPCVDCRGGRIRPFPAAARLGGVPRDDSGSATANPESPGKSIVEVSQLPLTEATRFFSELKLTREQREIAGELLKNIRERLQFLIDVGLDYLTLHRAGPTLSGGEAQRIRLASQIGSGLTGVLYVLDEPTIGLHPRDTQRLVRALSKLRDLGNTLLLVEHDREVIRGADHLLDFGPGAGAFGGRIVQQSGIENGRLVPLTSTASRDESGEDGEQDVSLTAEYLDGARSIPVPANRRPVPEVESALHTIRAAAEQNPNGGRRRRMVSRSRSDQPVDPDRADALAWLVVCGARHNNLRNLDVPIPLSRLICVTGVSGSGKSSLVNDILWPALSSELSNSNLSPGQHDAILGRELVDKVINVDQSPIGLTPYSNPATYTGAFDWIRELFARLPESKVRGWSANYFSFTRSGGRCEACEGYGQRQIEMHFMADVWVECEVCRGARYAEATLDVKFKNHSIADVLNMRVQEAIGLFENVPRVRRMLQTLADVGLDYVQLGQPAPTLSGGEAQRVKLATELGKPETGRTLYILDEPTTGLHFDDVRKLLEVFHRLVDLGNTVLVVEHNLDILKSADWIIDLGPEAGDGGGGIVAMGTPERVASIPASHTGRALEPVLSAGPLVARERYDPRAFAQQAIEAHKGGFGDIGKHTQSPWKLDGRAWHLEQRTSREGRPRRWEPQALLYIEELIQKTKKFAPTRWNERASVEIRADDAEHWFMHALTGGEWLLEVYLTVPRGVFRKLDLISELKLKTLDEREDLQTYGNWQRVDVRQRWGGLDVIVLYVHDKAEIDTLAFRRLVKRAMDAYLTGVVRQGQKQRQKQGQA